MSSLLRIGELASRAGVSTRTVDFYTSIGLLRETGRTAGNFRLYEPACVDRIAAIRALEANGVSLADMAVALDRGAEDLAEALGRIGRDLDTLRASVSGAAPEAHQLLTAVAARLQSLLTTAIELAGGTLPL